MPYHEPLIEAAHKGDLKLLKDVLKKNNNVNVIDLETKQTALHVAAMYGHDQIAAELIKCGISIEAVDYVKRTALHIACIHGYEKIVFKLLTNGANVNHIDIAGRSPLCIMCRQGRLNIVKILLDFNAYIEVVTMAEDKPYTIANEYYEHWKERGSVKITQEYNDIMNELVKTVEDGELRYEYARLEI